MDTPKDKTVLKKKIISVVIVIVILLVGVKIIDILRSGKWSGKIKVSGVIEGNDVRISFRVGGQIRELLVDEGYLVREGDLVAVLVKDELTKQRDEAAAALKRAEYQLSLDELDYKRAENLFQQGAISMQERDTAKTTADTDRANAENLRASLELAETKLGWADLASPLNGYVITKSSLAGEVVQVGEPVFTVIDLNDIWLTGYINESDLGRIKLNQKAAIATDSFPNKKYNGRISFISQQNEFTPKYIQTTEERVKYVYRIKVQADNSSLDLKPGMPADAYIDINE